MLRSTKLIATLGPATQSPEMLDALIARGVNVFRLNMSHGKHAWVREVVANIRAAADARNTPCAILMDLQGPSIRTGELSAPVPLRVGDKVEFRVETTEARAEISTTVNYRDLPKDVSVGDTVVVDNGLLHLKVVEKDDDRLLCTVLTEGTLTSRRHINLPGVRLNLPAMTAKDREDAALAAELQLDFIALSFVRDVAHVEEARAYLAERSHSPRIVSKIEDQEAVRNINGIIQASDVIMVARGDLGIEVHLEELPIIQRRIIKECIRVGRPVIVATHMLESMILNPLPTRAEITDVANAVFEQADAVMLSGETATGKYPVECVKVLDRVARRIALSGGAGYAEQAILETQRQKTIRSAVMLANSLDNSKLVVFTQHGVMADSTSHLRPESSPIFVFAPTKEAARHQTLNWNSHAFPLDFTSDPEETFNEAEKFLIRKNLVSSGDKLIVLRELVEGEEHFESIQIRTVP